jgi:hypothetical protein
MAEEVSIRNYTVGQQLREIANIQSFPTKLSDVITPVAIVNPADKPVLTSTVQRGDLTINTTSKTPSGTGNTDLDFLVPNGKKWLLKGFEAFNTVVGTFTSHNLILRNPAGTQINLRRTTSGAGSEKYPWSNADLVIPNGWTLRIRFELSAYTSGDVNGTLLYQEYVESQ